jgi:4-amino-4-deoxy-L-arabinose transferase-like glycosyltransferase
LNFKKKTLVLIAVASFLRCITAACIGLGNDEVYYRMYAQYLQWNYFDHPPMVGWLIRFTTADLFFDNGFFIRLGAIISAAATTWFFFLSGKKLNNDYTGFLAAVIYTATIYGSIIAGTFILPDSPQMVCWASGLYLLIDIVQFNLTDKYAKRKIILFGFVMGLGMLCKIHTSFLWLGFLLYIIFYNRQWLKEPTLYIAGIITLLFFYPVIKWNIDNNFVTYLYHSNRVKMAGGGFDITSFATFTAGQVMYYNPVIFFFIIAATVAAFKNKLQILLAEKRLLLLCSLPLIIIAVFISLFKNVLPHWTGPAYSGLILLTACYFSTNKKAIPAPLFMATALLAVITTAGIIVINFMPGTLGKKDKLFLGDGDFTLDMYGWDSLKKDLQQIFQRDLQTNTMAGDAVIISNKWFPAAHIDYYIALPLQKDVIAIGDTSDIHQYAWINKERKILQAGDDAYCIVPSNNYFDVRAVYAAYFATILNPLVIEQKRSGTTCRYFYIWRLKNFIAKNKSPCI